MLKEIAYVSFHSFSLQTLFSYVEPGKKNNFVTLRKTFWDGKRVNDCFWGFFCSYAMFAVMNTSILIS